MMNKRIIVIFIFVGIIVYALIFLFSIEKIQNKKDGLLINDVGRLYPTHIQKIIKENQTEQLKELLEDAREKKLNVSIAGSQHSQGGHTYYKDGIVINMKDYDEILNLNLENKIITVQSGATWDDVQNYINPYNLSVKVMQSSNVFTIGGTMSANAHGRDLDQTAMIETVKGFRLLLTNGTIINASRTENKELFNLVIGGYGMFGIILDADIQLVDNEIYKTTTKSIKYYEFPDYFNNHIKNNESIALMLVRPSIDPAYLFEDLTIFTWDKTNENSKDISVLKSEEHVVRDKFLFGLSRKYDWGKKLRWYLQKKIESKESELITRNNAMRPPAAPIELLEHNSERDTDILQEYFIPTRNFINFSDQFIKILKEDNVNVLSFTIRYVAPNNESYLSYAPNEEAFAIIYYSNVKLSEKDLKKTEKTIQKMVDLSINNNGTYYLTYNLFPTQDQIRKAYPNIDFVFSKKKEYDSQQLIMSKFYAKYALGENDEKYWQ